MKLTSDADYQAWKIYVRYRRMATSLLIFMGILTLLGYCLPAYSVIKQNFWWELILTGSQAGFIGGCADWFAVTALFRHPMGLPIPHTAILPKQQQRLGYGLGWFVAHYIFTEKDIVFIFSKIDLPSSIGRYLIDPNNINILRQIVLKAIPSFLDQLEDGRAGQVITKILYRLLSGEAISPFVGRILRTMVDNAQHQDVISFILEIVKKTLKEKEQNLRDMIHSRVREQGGRFVGWVIGDSIATKVLVAINKEMDRIDPHNEVIREKIGQWFKNEINKIENDPARMEKISEALKNFIDHESVKEWRENLWQQLRSLIEEDIKDEQGWLKNLITDSIQYCSNQLQQDDRIRQKLNNVILAVILRALPSIKTWIIQFTESTINQWDSNALIDRLECRIGKDLQYIRMNGSIVGFLIGLLLYFLLHLCFKGQMIHIM